MVASLGLVASLVLAGCGAPEAGDPGPVGIDDAALPVPSGSPFPIASLPPEGAAARARAAPSPDASAELCDLLGTVQTRLADLATLELRPTARVTLDIELSRIQAGFADMRQDALAARDLDLGDSVRRLGYALDDLALAVEDFRTTSRPRDAAEHVATDAAAFADALAGFELQTGC